MVKYSYKTHYNYKFNTVDCVTYMPDNTLMLTVYGDAIENSLNEVVDDIAINDLDIRYISVEYMPTRKLNFKNIEILLENVTHMIIRLPEYNESLINELKSISDKIEIL